MGLGVMGFKFVTLLSLSRFVLIGGFSFNDIDTGLSGRVASAKVTLLSPSKGALGKQERRKIYR